MKKLYPFLFLILLTTNCNKVKQGTKEALNKGGEVVGKAATEIADGLADGVEETLDIEIKLSEGLRQSGLSHGKFGLEDQEGGTDNRLVLYLIFEKDFIGELTAKAFDEEGLEMGRARIKAEASAGDAAYFDFDFNQRTNLETRSVITIE